MKYAELVDRLEQRGQYREADQVRWDVTDLSRTADQYDLGAEVLDGRARRAAERVLLEEG